MTMAGKTNPNDWEGGHDPELTGSEDKPMTRREHFDDSVRKSLLDEPGWWGDDPFAGFAKDPEPF